MHRMPALRTELLNLVTGLLLVFCGGLNVFNHAFEMGMNWIVFGSMYLVMDDYLQNRSLATLLERITDLSRNIFSWVGLIGSVILTGYYLTMFA